MELPAAGLIKTDSWELACIMGLLTWEGGFLLCPGQGCTIHIESVTVGDHIGRIADKLGDIRVAG